MLPVTVLDHHHVNKANIQAQVTNKHVCDTSEICGQPKHASFTALWKLSRTVSNANRKSLVCNYYLLLER